MKAIETKYNGYRFRSRTEARWAVFFDSLGLRYDYEKEGFDLDGEWYLPDFWLPHGCAMSAIGEEDFHIEIKPAPPTENEELKATRLAQQSRRPVFVFFGTPWLPDADRHAWGYFPMANNGNRHHMTFAWTECPVCHRCEVSAYGRVANLSCMCSSGIEGEFNDETGEDTRRFVIGTQGTRLVPAYNAARQARFEHGQSGALSGKECR